MIWFWVVVLVVLVGTVAVLAAGRDTSMAEAYDDRPDRTIPVGRPLTADDLQRVRFSSALRGYRMDEVDALIDRVAADLLARERELAAVRAEHERQADLEPAPGDDASVAPMDEDAAAHDHEHGVDRAERGGAHRASKATEHGAVDPAKG